MPETAIEQIRVRVLPDGRMSRRDTAAYTGFSEKTLTNWALNGHGPRPHRVGGRIFYFKADIDAFIQGDAAPVVSSASEEPEAA